jgi:hypothetical protein
LRQAQSTMLRQANPVAPRLEAVVTAQISSMSPVSGNATQTV